VKHVPRCPVCRKEAALRPENPYFPFCSQRCRQVDLGKWLGEEYRVGDRPADEQEDEIPPTEDDDGPLTH
jgi:endogenous inhibitor of DNA gyrase (YacG/DUF329 family)